MTKKSAAPSARGGARARPGQRRRVRERDGGVGAGPARAQPAPRRGRDRSPGRRRGPGAGRRASLLRAAVGSRPRRGARPGRAQGSARSRPFAAFDAFAQAGAPPWALALAARCRALLAEDPEPGFARGAPAARGRRPPARSRADAAAARRAPSLRGDDARRASRLRAALAAFERARRRRLGASARATAATRRPARSPSERERAACSPGSRRRSCRWRGSSPMATRTARSPRGCSAPPGPSTRSCAACSRSSAMSSRIELAELGLGTETPDDVLRSRLARAGLAELFRDLRTIRGASSRRRSRERWAIRSSSSPTGTPMTATPTPPASPSRSRRGGRALVGSRSAGREVAAIVHDAALDDDAELVEALCAAAGIVIENERLHDGVRGAARRAAGLKPADRRGGRRRAPPPRAQPARRRAAAAGRPRHAATARPVPHPARPGGRGGAGDQRDR